VKYGASSMRPVFKCSAPRSNDRVFALMTDRIERRCRRLRCDKGNRVVASCLIQGHRRPSIRAPPPRARPAGFAIADGAGQICERKGRPVHAGWRDRDLSAPESRGFASGHPAKSGASPSQGPAPISPPRGVVESPVRSKALVPETPRRQGSVSRDHATGASKHLMANTKETARHSSPIRRKEEHKRVVLDAPTMSPSRPGLIGKSVNTVLRPRNNVEKRDSFWATGSLARTIRPTHRTARAGFPRQSPVRFR